MHPSVEQYVCLYVVQLLTKILENQFYMLSIYPQHQKKLGLLSKSYNNKMIRNALKTFNKVIQPAAFSTYRTQGPFRIHTQEQNSRPYGKQDAEKVFQQFFKENPLKQSEKYIVKDENNTKKKQQDFEFSYDPHRVLGVKIGASKQQIDQAYRDLAIKYHPKVDSSPEAAKNFVEVSSAYEKLRPMKSDGKQKSYMNDFNSHIKQFLGLESKIGSSKKSSQSKTLDAQLYSQSKNISKIGDKKKVTIQRQFNKNGKLVKITQVEDHDENGGVHISETFDNGSEVKNNNYKA